MFFSTTFAALPPLLPSFGDLIKVLTLQEYNTRLVVVSTMILGAASGLVGSFLLLRKRSLMGDALSHATLPGICLAFIIMVMAGGEGKALPGLLAGAAVFGLLGFGCMMAIIRWTRLKDDTAMGIVLSVFFGLGIALMGIIQAMPQGSAAGLNRFIYGKTASMVWSDFVLISGAAVAAVVISLLLYKELTLLCFDDEYAASQGWPVGVLDILMLSLVTLVTVIGLQAVGLILVIALLIIPPAAARFWTERLPVMLIGAAVIGAFSGWLGSSFSALTPRMPAGAIIVIAGACVFLFSMIFGPSRGVLFRAMRHIQLTAGTRRQHLLRAMYELVEPSVGEGNKRSIAAASPAEIYIKVPVMFQKLLAARSWSKTRLKKLLRAAERQNLIRPVDRAAGSYALTEHGAKEAARVVRNHRLWEMYLITHADIAPSHVDRDADQIEHVLGNELVARLEKLLATQLGETQVPTSPHALG